MGSSLGSEVSEGWTSRSLPHFLKRTSTPNPMKGTNDTTVVFANKVMGQDLKTFSTIFLLNDVLSRSKTL